MGKGDKKKTELNSSCSLTCPQPCLAGVGNVNSFSFFEDLFLFLRAFAAAAATGIRQHLNKRHININSPKFLGWKDNTDTDNATQLKVFEF